ncbi:hypothetical protein AB0B45_42235 [Nonomuraea sp. NPDC049152]|uniref:hypothetical protein n=1 Tax=Nonomuraea sp. NPDC049152 TaxID=3154350 RepID=UPI0033DE1642
MRLLAALALIAAIVLVPAGTACACDCVAFVPKEGMERAAAVFTGTVKDTRRPTGSPLGPPPPYVVTFVVDQVYKGERVATVEVATNADEASCGYRFAVGARYLVFASSGPRESGLFSTDPGTSLYSSLCAGNVALRPGSGPLRRGDEAAAPGFAGQPITKELLATLGTPTPAPSAMSPESGPPLTPVAASSHGAGLPWGPITGGAVVASGAGALAWLLLRRRQDR